MRCPCGTELDYDACCGPFHRREAPPPTAEALMRARYSAYVRGLVDYVGETTAPETRADFDPEAAANWASQSEWVGLRIVRTERGGLLDDSGMVEFVAAYRSGGRYVEHRERSEFRKTPEGQWLFVRGAPPEPVKAGRNDPCPCGSGKKFKKCCAA